MNAETVERVALALWTKPAGSHLPGAPGSPERWEACKREALRILEAQRQWTETGEY